MMLGWILNRGKKGRSQKAKKKSTQPKQKSKKPKRIAKKPKKTVKKPKQTAKKPKQTVQKKSTSKSRPTPHEFKIGAITHYFPRPKAAVFKVVKKSLSMGDMIHVRGRHTDFKQRVRSMEINREHIQKARPGQEIGLQVKKRVRVKDQVFITSV
jgi:outer membrane biosynthesis protein TonB